MATIIPSSNVEVPAVFLDMFKDINRKFYGEETGNGLHTLGTPVAQVATTGPTAPEGERSFTNLQTDRSSAPTIEYEHNAGAVGGSSAAAAAAAVAAAQNANVVIQQQSEGGSVVVATTGGGNFKSEDHLSTAFNLAALMQNGFSTTTGTILSTQQAINKVVTSANNVQQQQNDQQRWSGDGSTTSGGNNNNDQQQQQQPQIVQWSTTGGKLQSYTTAQQQSSTSSKTKTKNRNDLSNQAVTTSTEVIYANPSTSGGNNILNAVVQQTPTPASTSSTTQSSSSAVSRNSNGSSGNNRRRSQNGSNNNANANNQQQNGVVVVKRYPCSHCQYSTDRRDLFTRHENIHKDEKPFQCYACMKQFNRADHVKKHFVRMHRELEYDINKTRRHLPNSTNRYSGGRSNVTIATVNTTNEQKPILHPPPDLQLDPAFLEIQRMPTTSSSLSIAETIEAVASATDAPLPQMKQETVDDGQIGGCGGAGETGYTPVKPKREKRFPCPNCEWAGADTWSLRRHINTHTRPYKCRLCDYTAARSERLSTHCLKVHQKHVCNKCAFVGETAEGLQTHVNEVHLIKMDAIDRNTASVAQDFLKAGGVHELAKLTAINPQLMINNKLPTTWTSKEAATFFQGAAQFLQQQQLPQQRSKYIGDNSNNNNMHNGRYYSINNRKRQRSNGDDVENTTPSSSRSSSPNYGTISTSPLKYQQFNGRASPQQKKPMSISDLEETLSNELKNNQNSSKRIKLEFEEENNQEQLIKSPPAYNKNTTTTTTTTKTLNNFNNQLIKTTASTVITPTSKSKRKINFTNSREQQQHCLDLMRDNKENANMVAAIAAATSAPAFLSSIEYQNMNKIVQDRIKEVIHNYFVMPSMNAMSAFTAQQQIEEQQLQQQQQQGRKNSLSETDQYIEFLKNKKDITLTITPKNKLPNKSPPKSQPELVTPSVTLELKPTQKKQLVGNNNSCSSTINTNNNNKRDSRKSISEIITSLPLLADAASSQQYLATPLDFSIKQENPATATVAATSSSWLSVASALQPINNDNSHNITLATITTERPEIALPPSATTIAVVTACTSDKRGKRSSRKQVKPTKIIRSPKVIMASLRDKYLTQMVRNKLSCRVCRKHKMSKIMAFNYHTTATLALHNYWAHKRHWECRQCGEKFTYRHSLEIHGTRFH